MHAKAAGPHNSDIVLSSLSLVVRTCQGQLALHGLRERVPHETCEW